MGIPRLWRGLGATTCTAALLSSAFAANYYVAPGGDNANPGTLAAPFLTIQRAADLALPGDTIHVRAGTYRETVTFAPGRGGTPGNPVTVQSYNDELVTVSGADTLPAGSWTAHDTANGRAVYRHSGMSWTLAATKPGNDQLFVDGVMVPEARWPNLAGAHPAVADRTKLALAAHGDVSTSPLPAENAAANAFYHHAGLAGFAADTLAGARIWLLPGSLWTPITGDVTANNPTGTAPAEAPANTPGANLTFSIRFKNGADYALRDGDYFYLYGHLGLLDEAGEWFRDPATGTLYLWAPGGGSPATRAVEAKRRELAFDLGNVGHVTLRNLRLFAAGIRTSTTSAGVVLEGIEADYVYHHQWVDGWWSTPATALTARGAGSVIRDCTVRFSSGNGILILGDGSRAENNVVLDVTYTGANAAAFRGSDPHASSNSDQMVIERNTVRGGGASDMLDLRYIRRGLARFNDVSEGGKLIVDGGQVMLARDYDGQGTEIAYNYIHDSKSIYDPSRSLWGNSGIYFEGNTRNYLLHHNLILRNTGPTAIGLTNIPVPMPANVRIYHHTTDAEINVMSETGITGLDVRNNVLSRLASTRFPNTFRANFTTALTYADNLGGAGASPGYAASAATDYRPAAGSPLREATDPVSGVNDAFAGAAPDIGAFEADAPAWVPGAVVTQRQLPALVPVVVATAAGTVDLRIDGLPVGRRLGPDLRVRVGAAGGPSGPSIQNLDTWDARFLGVPTGGQGGVQTIYARIGSGPWTALAASVDVGAASTRSQAALAGALVGASSPAGQILPGSLLTLAENGTDFGGVPISGATPVTATFTLTNHGNTALALSGSPLAALSGPQAGDFTVLSAPAASLAPGASTTFSVRFSPLGLGLRRATLTLTTNDPLAPSFAFALRGVGATTQPAAAPTGFTATTQSAYAVALAWTDVGPDEAGYTLEAKAGSAGTWTTVATLPANTTVWTHANLVPGTNYVYRLAATNTNGSSPWSREANATTLNGALPLLRVYATHDAHIRGGAANQNVAFGTGSILELRSANVGNARKVWLKFDLSGLPATYTAASLNLTYAGASAAFSANRRLNLYSVADGGDGWSEATLTWLNAPGNLTASGSGGDSGFSGGSANLRGQTTYNPTPAAGTVLSVGDSRLTTAVNSLRGADGLLTLALGVTTTANANINEIQRFASHENTTYDGPYLELTPAQPPASAFAPNGLSATPVSPTRVNLAWTDHATAETGYEIQRLVGAGAYAPLVTLAAGATSYADTAATPGAVHTYRVRATGSPASDWSAEVATTTPDGLPAAPSALAATPQSPTHIALAWTDHATDETGYTIERSPASGSGFATLATLGANATAYTDATAAPLATYFYRIRATNTFGASAPSPEASATTPSDQAPPTPAAPAAYIVSGTSIRLIWTDASAAETAYLLERRFGADPFVVVAPLPANTSAHLDAGLAPGVAYAYRLRATNALGSSAPSPEALPVAPAWTLDAAGNWSTATHWTGGFAPSGVGAPVLLGAVITASRTVTLDQDVTLGQLTFNEDAVGASAYVVALGTGRTLTFDVPSGQARLLARGSGGYVVGNQGVGQIVLADTLAISAGSAQIGPAGSATVTVNAPLSGPGGLVLSSLNSNDGSGTQVSGTRGTVLRSSLANTFSGGVDVASGLVKLSGHIGNLGSGPLTLRTSSSDGGGSFGTSLQLRTGGGTLPNAITFVDTAGTTGTSPRVGIFAEDSAASAYILTGPLSGTLASETLRFGGIAPSGGGHAGTSLRLQGDGSALVLTSSFVHVRTGSLLLAHPHALGLNNGLGGAGSTLSVGQTNANVESAALLTDGVDVAAALRVEPNTNASSGDVTFGGVHPTGSAAFTGPLTLHPRAPGSTRTVRLSAAAGGALDFDGVIADAALGANQPLPVSLGGAGLVRINAANTFVGAVTVESDATLGGVGSLAGPLVLASGSRLAFVLATPAAAHDRFETTGTLGFGGANTVTITSPGGAAPGTYVLLRAGSPPTGPLPALVLPTAWSGSLQVFGNELQLLVTFVPAPLQSWRHAHFGTTANSGPAADLADPDGDGAVNLLEYALATDPQSSGAVPAPTLQVSGASTQPSFLQITFLRARSELTYTVEASSTLATDSWQPIATNPGAVSLTTPVTVTDSAPLSAGRRFLRLRVTQ